MTAHQPPRRPDVLGQPTPRQELAEAVTRIRGLEEGLLQLGAHKRVLPREQVLSVQSEAATAAEALKMAVDRLIRSLR